MFDIRYYFCRRGTENFQQFSKDMFQLHFDSETGISYVKKIQDEETKNHRETDSEIITGFMPQMLDTNGRPHKMCPVHSFENYVSHLNPKIQKLWQRPLNKIPKQGNVWYAVAVLGHNPIKTFMANLSTICELSDYYTNRLSTRLCEKKGFFKRFDFQKKRFLQQKKRFSVPNG